MKKLIAILLATVLCFAMGAISFAIDEDPAPSATQKQVLVWTHGTESTHINTAINIWGGETVCKKVISNSTTNIKLGGTSTSDITANEMQEYALICLFLPLITENDVSEVSDNTTNKLINTKAIQNFLNAGGRLYIQTEGSIAEESLTDLNNLEKAANKLSKQLGAGFNIDPEYSFSYGDSITAAYVNGNAELSDNISDVSDSKSPAAAGEIVATGDCNYEVVLYGIINNAPKAYVMDIAVGKGRITVVSDVNALGTAGTNSNYGGYKQLLTNMLSNATANKAAVAAGEDPNANFGVVEVGTEEQFAAALGKCSNIKLTDDITLNNGYTINGSNSVKIEGQGYKLTRGNSNTGTMFTVTDGKLELTNVTVDGGANWSEGTPATRTNDGIKATGQMFVVSGGTLTLGNGAILQNNHRVNDYQSGGDQGSAIYVSGTGNLEMDAKATIKDCAVTSVDGDSVSGDGAAVAVNGGNKVVITGKITGNYSGRMGGAVRIFQTNTDSTEVIFKDVEITGNYTNASDSYDHGAVLLGRGVTFEGVVVIKNNFNQNGKEANLSSHNVAGYAIEGTNGLSAGSKIGVKVSEAFKLDSTVLSSAEADDLVYFTVDNNELGLIFDPESNVIKLSEIEYVESLGKPACDHDLDENGKCKDCGVVIITYPRDESEANPNTGAPVISGGFAVVALAAVAYAVSKHK